MTIQCLRGDPAIQGVTKGRHVMRGNVPCKRNSESPEHRKPGWDGFRCSKSPMVTGLGTLGHLISPGSGGKEFRVGRTTGPLETIQLSQPFPEFPTFRSLSPSCSQFFPLIPAFSHNFPLVPVISRYRHDAPFWFSALSDPVTPNAPSFSL